MTYEEKVAAIKELEKRARWWDAEDCESWACGTPREALDCAYQNGLWDGDGSDEDTMELQAGSEEDCRPGDVGRSWMTKQLAELLFEWLDEEMGHPSDPNDVESPSPELLAKLRAVVDEATDGYNIRRLKVIGTVVLTVAEVRRYLGDDDEEVLPIDE